MSSSEKAWQALVLTPCKLSTKPVACSQQQYYCICRTSKENVKQKWLLLWKYCGSSAQELYNPHWNSPKPYFLLALSNENSHASLTRHRSRRYAAEQGVYGACTIALVSPNLQRWACSNFDSVGKAMCRRNSEVPNTPSKLWFCCEVSDEKSLYNCISTLLFTKRLNEVDTLCWKMSTRNVLTVYCTFVHGHRSPKWEFCWLFTSWQTGKCQPSLRMKCDK